MMKRYRQQLKDQSSRDCRLLGSLTATIVLNVRRLLIAFTIISGSAIPQFATTIAEDSTVRFRMMMADDPELLPPPAARYVFQPGLTDLWRKAFDRPDAELRRMLVDTLTIAHQRGVDGIDEFQPKVVALLEQGDQPREVIRALVKLLVTLEAKGQSELLAKVAIRTDPSIGQIIESALIQWKSSELRDHWLARLRERTVSTTMLIKAMEGVTAIGENEAIEPLTEIISDPNASLPLRMAAAKQLGQLHPANAVTLAESLRESASSVDELEPMLAIELLQLASGEPTITLLQSLMEHSRTPIVARALKRLFEIDPALADEFAPMLVTSSDSNLRRILFQAMLIKNDTERIPLIASLLDDLNPSLRHDVAEGMLTLANDHRDTVISETMKVITENSWRGCEQACYVLAKLDHKPAGDRMVQLLDHPRGETKIAAAWGLMHLRIDKHLANMHEHARIVCERFMSGENNDGTPGVTTQLALLFNAFGDRRYHPSETLMREYLPKDFTLGEEPRSAAAWALGYFFEEDAPEDLVRVMRERLGDIDSLEPESDAVRAMCAISLGRMKAERTVPDLKRFATGIGDVSQACSWAINRITGEPPLPRPEPPVVEIGSWFLYPAK